MSSIETSKISVSAPDGNTAIRRVHTLSILPLQSFPNSYPWKSTNVVLAAHSVTALCQCCPGWTQNILNLRRRSINQFLSPLLFPSGNQCYDSVVCPCSEFLKPLSISVLPCCGPALMLTLLASLAVLTQRMKQLLLLLLLISRG